MRGPCRIRSLPPLIGFVLGGALLIHAASAAAPCIDLPPSTLQVLDIKAKAVQETLVSKAELDRDMQPEELVSRHGRMLSATDLVAWFDIEHRMIPRDDGSVCDAPVLVRMAFGASHRLAVFVREAAQNLCLRQRMQNHEADHASLFNDVIDRFIDENRSLFQQGMIALKQTPAPDAGVARARWEIGMRRILDEAKRQLLAQIQAANAQIDASPRATAMNDTCTGAGRAPE
jgi:hypothetical protein